MSDLLRRRIEQLETVLDETTCERGRLAKRVETLQRHAEGARIVWQRELRDAEDARDRYARQLASAEEFLRVRTAALNRVVEQLDAVRKLYHDTCAATVDSCSEDLDVFLSDLSVACGLDAEAGSP